MRRYQYKRSKAYIWTLYQFHKDELTNIQQKHIECYLGFNKEWTDRRWLFASVKRLEKIEYGAARRMVKNT